jgi:hypothetical protein
LAYFATFGALAVVAVVGIVATIELFHEPACPQGENGPVRVLVAKSLIPAGTSGAVIVNRRMYVATSIPCNDRESGALADPADLLRTTTVADIFPGQQFTEADFTSS